LSAQRPYIQETQLSKYLHLKPLKNHPFLHPHSHISLDLIFQRNPEDHIPSSHTPIIHHSHRLELEGNTGSANNSSLDSSRLKELRNLVRDLGQGALGSSVLAVTKVVALGNSVTTVGTVERLLGLDPDVVLDEELGTLARVDAIGDVLVVVVVEVASSEAERRATRVDVEPVVVVVGDGQVALVFAAVAVRVADQRALPVVVHEAVGDGDVVSGVCNVEETVVVVLVVVEVGGEVDVVNPDVLGFLDGNGIAADDLLHGEVAEDDVLDCLDCEGEVGQDDGRVLSDDGLVAANLDVLSASLDGSGDENDSGILTLDGGLQLAEGADLDGLASLSSRGTSVLGSETGSGDILQGCGALGETVTLGRDLRWHRCCQSRDGHEAERHD
jgi:hypothetical protein